MSKALLVQVSKPKETEKGILVRVFCEGTTYEIIEHQDESIEMRLDAGWTKVFKGKFANTSIAIDVFNSTKTKEMLKSASEAIEAYKAKSKPKTYRDIYAVEQYLGGFPQEIFDHELIVSHIKSGNAANGGGYIGRCQNRSKEADEATYAMLKNLSLGDDFIAMFLTSVFGRWYAESIQDGFYRNPEKFNSALGQIFKSGTKAGWLKVEYSKRTPS